MSQAEDLLDGVATLSAELPTEGHIVIGIDRFITVPDGLKKIAVQYDHNVTTVTFDCPRYWDGNDLSKMKIYVNYMRPDGSLGCSLCANVTVDPDDLSLIHFDWTISGHVTEFNGSLSFLVCIKKVDDEGTEVNHWNSEMNSDLYISEGLECEPTVLRKYPDIITQLLKRMEELEYYTANAIV